MCYTKGPGMGGPLRVCAVVARMLAQVTPPPPPGPLRARFAAPIPHVDAQRTCWTSPAEQDLFLAGLGFRVSG